MSEHLKKNKKRPPYRIETERTVIRCLDPNDASLMLSAISENLDHLGPWMEWVAHEPESLEAKTNRLQKSRDDFNSDIDYMYGIFNTVETELIGGTGLHPRIGPNAFEIGYWISHTRINQGLATEVASALTRVAFEICGVARIEIRCDPANVRSGRVPEKLGFVHSTTLLNNATTVDGKPRNTMVWLMAGEGYPKSHSRDAQIKAFDDSDDSIALWS